MAALLGVLAAIYLYVAPDDMPGQTVPEPQAQLRIAPGKDAGWVAEDGAETAEEFDDRYEMVLGISVRKDRKCTVELKDYVTPDGEMFQAYSCTPNNPPPPHPYADYDNATLEAMAYSDADAAALLGQRLIGQDNGKSYQMLVRATALDGDVTHLHWLADQAFSAVKINDEVQVDNLKRRYELTALAARLGGNPANPYYWKNELVNAGVAEADIAVLDSQVERLLRKVQDIQLTVFGEVRHGGGSDA
jgi:hypothetical protein